MERNCIVCNSGKTECSTCEECKNVTCSDCKQTYNLNSKSFIFECIFCNLKNLNPFVEVTQILSPLQVIKAERSTKNVFLELIDCTELEIDYNKKRDEFIKNKFGTSSKKIDDQYREYDNQQAEIIELRCIKLDSRGYKILGEQTWPDSFTLSISSIYNDLLSEEPIGIDLSQKKRKDSIFQIRLTDFFEMLRNCKEKRFSISLKNHYDDKNSFVIDQNKSMYGFIMVMTKSFNKRSITSNKQVRTLSLEDSKLFIKSLFNQERLNKATDQYTDILSYIKSIPENELNGENGKDIQENEIKMDLKNDLTLSSINNPVRGNKCYHINCFDIKDCFDLYNSMKENKLYCPICKTPIQYFYYDKNVEEIIKKAKGHHDSVTFLNTGDLKEGEIGDYDDNSFDNDGKEVISMESLEDEIDVEEKDRLTKNLQKIISNDRDYYQLIKQINRRIILSKKPMPKKKALLEFPDIENMDCFKEWFN